MRCTKVLVAVFKFFYKYFWITAELLQAALKFWVLYTENAVCLVPPLITVNLTLQDFLLKAGVGRGVGPRPRQGSFL